MRTSVRYFVAGLCLVCLVTVGTAGPLARATAAPAPTLAARIVWRNCGARLQCARVQVPLDWSRPNGEQIELAVIQHLASRPKARIGSIFINPGGPGESGVELVRNAGAELDAWGAGRFNVVSWDPRGTNASDPVRCFTSQASEARFWRRVQIPMTAAESRAYERKTIELARRCGRVSGQLLAHISTADSARDLDDLRRLVGDRRLTYVGISYGTFLGQTYANMFPGHVRAILLDAVVDQRAWARSAEARNAAIDSTGEVFKQFLTLCQRAGHTRCALAGHPETAAQRVARLFRQARRAPIPAPHARPPGKLSYSDLLLTTLNPLRTRRRGPSTHNSSTQPPTATRPPWKTRRAGCEPQPHSPRRRPRRRSSVSTVPRASPSALGPGSSDTSPNATNCGDRSKVGRNGPPAPRTGRRAAPTATPDRGTAGRRRRSC